MVGTAKGAAKEAAKGTAKGAAKVLKLVQKQVEVKVNKQTHEKLFQMKTTTSKVRHHLPWVPWKSNKFYLEKVPSINKFK